MRLCNIEKVDNGFVLQTLETETGEGINVFQKVEDLYDAVGKMLGIEPREAPIEKFPFTGTEFDASAPDPEAGTPWDKADVPAPGLVVGTPAYDAELQRMVEQNDRVAAHSRLQKLVVAGAISEYNNRLGVKALVDLIRRYEKISEAAPLPTEPKSEAPRKHFTTAEVGAELSAASGRAGFDKAFAILSRYGATKASDLPEDKRAEVIEAARALK